RWLGGRHRFDQSREYPGCCRGLYRRREIGLRARFNGWARRTFGNRLLQHLGEPRQHGLPGGIGFLDECGSKWRELALKSFLLDTTLEIVGMTHRSGGRACGVRLRRAHRSREDISL